MNLATTLAFATVYCAAITNAAEVVFPGAEWESKAPPELGLDEARLEAVAEALGSRGCAIKNGYVVKTWGARTKRGLVFFGEAGAVDAADVRREGRQGQRL